MASKIVRVESIKRDHASDHWDVEYRLDLGAAGYLKVTVPIPYREEGAAADAKISDVVATATKKLAAGAIGVAGTLWGHLPDATKEAFIDHTRRTADASQQPDGDLPDEPRRDAE